jgi:hypothetical protein
MNERGILTMILAICALLFRLVQAESNPGVDATHADVAVTILPGGLKSTETTLEIRYQVRNDSAQDIWLCDDIDAHRSGLESYMDEDLQTLKVRRRLDVSFVGRHREQPIGRYSRLRPGECRSESLLLHLPVERWSVFTSGARPLDDLIATQLCVEIGFYRGDFRGMILHSVEDLPEPVYDSYPAYPRNVAEWLGGLKGRIRYDERPGDRDERVVLPWSRRTFKGEEVLQVQVRDLHIPCLGRLGYVSPGAPSFHRCTRVEVCYQPSALDYFYPYEGQRSLLSSEEKESLSGVRTITVTDPALLKTFADEIAKGFWCEVIQEGSTARVTCYGDDGQLGTFTAYGNMAIETEDRQRFRYSDGLQSLRRLAPEIRPFELRMQYADNLKDLWYRIRWYGRMTNPSSADPSGKRRMAYPEAEKWGSATVSAFERPYHDLTIMNPYRCASAGKGECHYSMNPACDVNSPPDTVLLFETKAGWNQHGGPELFTFDNHDPKGGLVLLNDGTVKFIRTEEELKQLRWK